MYNVYSPCLDWLAISTIISFTTQVPLRLAQTENTLREARLGYAIYRQVIVRY